MKSHVITHIHKRETVYLLGQELALVCGINAWKSGRLQPTE